MEDLSFASTTARYVRMYGTQRATQYGYSLWEFEVYSGSTGTSNPAYTVYPGFVGTELQNNTKGAWRDDQIYVTVLGRDPASGVFSWLKPDGTLTHAAVADNDANGHLIKNGVNYPNYAFTLAQSKLLKLPKMDSGRVFISLGEPVYLKVLSDVNGNIGYAGPNPLNPTDPNIAVNFDWYEFTYNTTGLWINTTQVDEFGVPLLLDVYGANQTFHAQTGITESVSALYNEYVSQTPAEFHTPTPALPRIMAPGKSTFDVGQANGNYFDSYVNQMWTYYTSNTLTVDMWGGSRRFSGRVQGNTLVFTEVNLATARIRVARTTSANPPRKTFWKAKARWPPAIRSSWPLKPRFARRLTATSCKTAASGPPRPRGIARPRPTSMRSSGIATAWAVWRTALPMTTCRIKARPSCRPRRNIWCLASAGKAGTPLINQRYLLLQ